MQSLIRQACTLRDNAAGYTSGEVSGFIPHDVFQIRLGHPRDRVSFYFILDFIERVFYTLVTKRKYGCVFVRFVELGGGYLLSLIHI